MQGPIQSLEYNQNVVHNEPKNMIFYYSRRCNDCSIFSKTLNHFLSLNVDEKGHSIYNVQSVCIDRKNPHHLPSVLRYVPAIIYNQRIYQGKEAFEWINEFTSSKTFVPMGTEKSNISSAFLDGTDNIIDSTSTKIEYPQGQGQNPNVGQNFNEEEYMKNLMDNRGIPQAQPQQEQQPELPDALKPQKIDKNQGQTQVNAFYQQLISNRETNQPRAPSSKFDPTPQRQPHQVPVGQSI